jgi:hypothetical protein
VNCLECPGVRFLDGEINPLDQEGYPDHGSGYSIGVHDINRPNTDVAMNVLEGLNLGQTIYVDDHRFRAYREFTMSFTYFRLTELSVGLLDACDFQLKDKVFERVIDSDQSSS